MSYRDLREWIQAVEKIGELKTIKGADWDLEIGGLMTLFGNQENGPALLFDEIKGYPAGYRVLTSSMDALKRTALTLGMGLEFTPMEFVEAWRKRVKEIRPRPPVEVKDGPVLENIHQGKDINIYEFPTPRWFELDGGRYIGTGSVTITRDPDDGWINLGTYRVMIHDESTLGFYISPGKHGRIHRDKYFARGEPCRVAISLGHNPLFYLAGSAEFPYGFCEYDFIGGVQGEPVEVIKGEFTGLPIPAHAEIAIEGESLPEERRIEGPFGEWTGYYGSDARPEPLIRIKTIMHRNDPILLGFSPRRALRSPTHKHFLLPAQLWNELEAAGLPDVKGVWFHECGIMAVAIKQRYPGHARQAGLLATSCRSGAYMGRYVIVVDDDIDPSDIRQLLWAVGTRSDPVKSLEVIRRCWSTALDPAIPKGEKGLNSRAVIDACKPFEWMAEFPAAVTLSKELEESLVKKWAKTLAP